MGVVTRREHLDTMRLPCSRNNDERADERNERRLGVDHDRLLHKTGVSALAWILQNKRTAGVTVRAISRCWLGYQSTKQHERRSWYVVGMVWIHAWM